MCVRRACVDGHVWGGCELLPQILSYQKEEVPWSEERRLSELGLLFRLVVAVCWRRLAFTPLLMKATKWHVHAKPTTQRRRLFSRDSGVKAAGMEALTGIPGRAGWAQSSFCRGWLTSSRAPSRTRSAGWAELWSGTRSEAATRCCSETPWQTTERAVRKTAAVTPTCVGAAKQTEMAQLRPCTRLWNYRPNKPPG